MHEKPKFTNNQHVAFDFGNGTSGTGFIKGLAFEHIIDGWIVEVETSQGIDKSFYPWSCIVVNHPQLRPLSFPTVEPKAGQPSRSFDRGGEGVVVRPK